MLSSSEAQRKLVIVSHPYDPSSQKGGSTMYRRSVSICPFPSYSSEHTSCLFFFPSQMFCIWGIKCLLPCSICPKSLLVEDNDHSSVCSLPAGGMCSSFTMTRFGEQPVWCSEYSSGLGLWVTLLRIPTLTPWVTLGLSHSLSLLTLFYLTGWLL